MTNTIFIIIQDKICYESRPMDFSTNFIPIKNLLIEKIIAR